MLISRATREKSAFYFSDSPFWFSGTMPSYCMTVLWRRRFIPAWFLYFFVLHSVIISLLGNWVPGSNNNNNNNNNTHLPIYHRNSWYMAWEGHWAHTRDCQAYHHYHGRHPGDNIPFPTPFHGSAKRKCGFFPQHHVNRVNCRCNHKIIIIIIIIIVLVRCSRTARHRWAWWRRCKPVSGMSTCTMTVPHCWPSPSPSPL